MAMAIQTETLALLGSTGKTGRVVLKLLLAKDAYNFKVYVRSKERLISMFPAITSNPRVQIYVGPVTDQNLLEKCLSEAQIIICTLGSNDYVPSTVLRESAFSIVTALKALKERDVAWQRPRMIYLSSSSENKHFAAARPKFVDWLIQHAFQEGYADLNKAQDVILADPSLISVLLVQPGLLVEEDGSGYEISVESVKLAASYNDLGGAFVELALVRGYDQLGEAGVSSQKADIVARYAPVIFSRLFAGLFVVYFPWGQAIRLAMGQAFSWIF